MMTWPSAVVGSEELYGVDLTKYLRNEGDDVVSVLWSLPNGLVSMMEAVEGTVAYIKVQAKYCGNYSIAVQVDSVDKASPTRKQTTFGKVYLEVNG